MRILLDRHSPEPIYLQIRDRFRRLITAGMLQPGDRLPSIRALASSVQVNKLTVVEAYNVLEADGLIHARQGAGYFVSDRAIAKPPKESTFSPRQEVIIPDRWGCSFFDLYTTSLHVKDQPEIIDFTSGFSQPLGLEDLQRLARRAMGQLPESLFCYDYAQGQQTLRQQIARLLMQEGLAVSPDHLIVTNGSQQGLALAIQAYVRPGDWVIVESPTYHGTLALLETLGARVIGIPMAPDGMNLTLLAQYLESHRPKLIYTVSTLHNPTGITTSQAHRQALLDLAEHYDCWILEDNAYEGLNFEPVPPPIKALDTRDRVIYLGTFSKTLTPGLRVGYVVATGPDHQNLLERKLLQDLHVSTVSQAIVSEYLASGHYRHHLSRLRHHNQRSQQAMLQALEQHFPLEASWTVPQGGMFLWVELPDRLPLREICNQAIAHQVLVSCGDAFFPGQRGYPAMRLNFSQPPEAIERGIRVLGTLLKQHSLRLTG
ncbi:PLP-dependent aminotransferase family protein [Geitlerinema sp. PCC 7407]|uniref:MocR-like pyridoxine biosynthesis transcription factor PdxR n=1 Tax=Geitlerinema sp. PCC 7407 TaxID=1173025 RepID=UPI00029FC136|nr:PLP-dependent aminotransferase family protein [Geitlerinema sp. PCC 7407]AFY66956.1 transcriptional regulator, GntR family with aminotransferase domain [Geitlerinema sp. PCC 7407]